MKKTSLNHSTGSRGAVLAVSSLLAIMASSALAANPLTFTNTPITFDTSASVSGSWWINGWGGQSANTAYSATQDHTGNGGGSLNIVDDFHGGSQCVNIGWFGGAWGSSPKYDLTLYTNVNFWVKLDTNVSTVPLTTFNSTGDSGIQLWGIGSGNAWITLANLPIPNEASNGWVNVNWIVNNTIAGINNLLGFGIKKWTGGTPTNGITSFYVDDFQMIGSFVPPPPPTMIPPRKANAGLNLTAVTGPYTREQIALTNGEESFLTGNPTYSFTISQGVDGTGGAAFQNHIFLVPSPGTESGVDWTEPNLIFLDLEANNTGGTTWTFRYKTNNPNGNNMAYNPGGLGAVTVTAGGSGYTSSPTVVFTGGGGTVGGSLAQIDAVAGTVTNVIVTNSWGFATAPAISFIGGGGTGATATTTATAAGVGGLSSVNDTNRTGTWTLSVSGGNTFTMTTPSGNTTNVVLDPTVTALFPAPVRAYFGAQCGNAAGVGQLSVLGNITITGTANPINDTFKNDATLNTNLWLAQGDANAVMLIPGAAPYVWVDWTVPASGYSLQTGSTLQNFIDTTPIMQTQMGTNIGALVLQLPGNQFYRTIKRVPTQLQVLLPGEANAPGTLSGKSGTPTAQSLSVNFGVVPVTVNMCDATWHIINSSVDTVHIVSSDTSATLPVDSALVNGTLTTTTFSFGSTGTWTVTASDVSDNTMLSNTSSSVVVGP